MPLSDPSTPTGYEPGAGLVPPIGADAGVDPVAETIKLAKEPSAPAERVDPAVAATISLAKNKGVFKSADEFAAESLGQTKLNDADLSPYQRAKLAFMSDTEEERTKAFKAMFPEGDYVEIPTKDGPTALFRTSLSEDFSKVDKSAMEKYKKEGFGSAAHEVLGDAAEFLSPQSLQTLADLAIFRGKGGVLLNTLKAGVSALTGETVRQSIQDVSGTSAETPLEQGGEIVGAGVGNAAGSLLVGGGARLGRAAMNRGGIFEMKPGAVEAEAAAKRLGLPDFSVDQLIESPLIERLAKQSSAVSRNMAKLSRAQSDLLTTTTKALVNESDRKQLLTRARDVIDMGEDHLKAIESNIMPAGKTLTPMDLGNYLKTAHKEVDQKVWKPAVDDAYAVARSIEDPEFDLSNVIDIAKKLKAGTWTPSAPIEETVGKMPNGSPIVVRTQEPVRLDRLDGDVKGVVDDILAMDPSLPSTMKTPIGDVRVADPRSIEASKLHSTASDDWKASATATEQYGQAHYDYTNDPTPENRALENQAFDKYVKANETSVASTKAARDLKPNSGINILLNKYEIAENGSIGDQVNVAIKLSEAHSLASKHLESGISRTDRLRALVERLQDASLPGPEGARRSNYVANELRGSVQDTLDNPVNANPDFVTAWTGAKNLARERFSKNEAAVVRQLVATETPEDIGNMLVQPGVKPSTLLAMRNAIKPADFEQIRYGFLRRVLNQKGQIPEYLGQFDQNALETLLPGNYKAPMMEAAKGFQELAKSGVPEALERHTQLRGFTDAIANQADTASIDALYSITKKAGGPQSDFGRSIRAAFLDKIIEDVSSQARISGTQFNSKAMAAALKDFEDRGLLKFLTPEDVNVLKDGQVVRQFMEATGADVGAAIEGTSVAKGIFLRGSISKLTEYLQLASIGRLLTSDTGRKLLIARGGPNSMPPLKFASYTGAMMSELARQNMKRNDGGEKGYEELDRIMKYNNIRKAASQ